MVLWYKELERKFKNGYQDGIEIAWYENGIMSYQAIYKAGKKDGTKEYEILFLNGKEVI